MSFLIILSIYFFIGLILGILVIRKNKTLDVHQKVLAILGAIFLWAWFFFNAIKINKNINRNGKNSN